MLDINFLKNSKFFTKITLQKNEVLFDEWDLDNNLYIILAWELSVEKYTTRKKDDTKILGHLIKDAVFWEWALNSNQTKELKLTAKSISPFNQISVSQNFTNDKYLNGNSTKFSSAAGMAIRLVSWE